MQRKTTYSLLTIMVLLLQAHASDFASSGYAEGGAQYLRIPFHAHCAGLGGAVAAWQEEIAGLQFNPAILDAAPAESIAVIGSYAFMTLDRKHAGVDGTISLGEFLVGGISFAHLGVGEIEGRDTFGNLGNDFTYGGNAFALTLAGRLQIPISWGVRARYLFERMLDEHANGIGFDLGATYRPVDQLCIGVSALNVGSRLWWSTEHDDPVLPEARLAVAGLFLEESLISELDIAKTTEEPLDVLFGLQYKLLGMLSFRAGFATSLDIADRDYRDFDFFLGAGMRYSFLGFDYACPITSSKLGVTHRISVVGKIPLR